MLLPIILCGADCGGGGGKEVSFRRKEEKMIMFRQLVPFTFQLYFSGRPQMLPEHSLTKAPTLSDPIVYVPLHQERQKATIKFVIVLSSPCAFI